MTEYGKSWYIMTFCHKNKKHNFFANCAITTFLSRKFMITRSSIAFENFLGSSIAPQVMPPWTVLTLGVGGRQFKRVLDLYNPWLGHTLFDLSGNRIEGEVKVGPIDGWLLDISRWGPPQLPENQNSNCENIQEPDHRCDLIERRGIRPIDIGRQPTWVQLQSKQLEGGFDDVRVLRASHNNRLPRRRSQLEGDSSLLLLLQLSLL